MPVPARLRRTVLATQAFVVTVFVLALAASSPAAAATVNVTVQNNFYSPPSPTINQGDTVKWTWSSGGITHSVTRGACTPGCAAADPNTAGEFFDSGILASGTFSHTFTTPGDYTYFCRVHGSIMQGTIHVAAAAALACNPMANPPAGNPPLNVQLTANPTGGTPPYTFAWDFDDGTAVSTTQNPQHQFTALGTYDVTLTLTDNALAQKICHAQVIVSDLACTADADPNSGDAPLIVSFTADATGGDPNVTFMWDFDDGSAHVMGATPQHTFLSSGTFQVTLMGEDAVGVPCSDTVTVAVSLPGCVPGDGDADQVCDDADDCPGVYNPGQQDTDFDGFGNACDNCAGVYNPGQEDLDDDGEGDACDLTVLSPHEGDVLTDCATPPTILWSAGAFDRFKVFLSTDDSFPKETSVNSGSTLLKDSMWTVPRKKWKKICGQALAGGHELFVQVFGKNRATKATTTSEPVGFDIGP